jgi:aminocarboxymuconate-semialdehyde decarboxylase
MPVVDCHAHVTPERYKVAVANRGYWYGLDARAGELHHGGFANSIDDRLAEMERLGVDMQLVTPSIGFYQYENSVDVTERIHRECNSEIHDLVTTHPDRFLGLGMIPMQDTAKAITELERIIRDLGFKGVILNDHVAGTNYDDPRFIPFFAAAEDLGALLFFHQGGETITTARNPRYKLPNAVGNLTERTLLYATRGCGRVHDRYPDLRILLAHGGGFVPYGIARLDKVAGALPGDFDGGMNPPFGPNDGFNHQMPPSEYLDRFYYDCCTYSGPVLRFLVDTVGIERVVLGTDYPAPMFLHDPVNWVRGLDELEDSEKEAILVDNSNRLLEV